MSAENVTPPTDNLIESELQVKLAEYGYAQDMLKHYDSLNWQIGSILIGANAVLLGLVANILPRTGWYGFLVALAVSLFSFLLLDAWFRWFSRHRELYNFRNETLHRIEAQLGMYHFLRIVEVSRAGKLTDAQKLQLETARAAAYAIRGSDDFVPFYSDLTLGGTSGYDLARWLRRLVPVAEFLTLAFVVVALNA